MTPEQMKVRARLHKDFSLYARNALKIRTKTNEIKPLILNNAQTILEAAVQKDMASRGYVRIIILKARQQGLSTVVGGRCYFKVSQNRARKAMVVTHHADSTRALFDMTKRFHDQCPPILKPSTKYSSRKELSFDKLDSSFVVATAGGESIGRGETLSDLHASEYAFWSASSAKENLNGLLKAVPAAPDTSVFIESTANGFNHFHEMWVNAVNGSNGYTPVFIPWFADPEYSLPVPQNFELTPDEVELQQKFDLTLGQLAWRRREIGESGLDLFKQEYPSVPEEAFLTTGRPVFNPEIIFNRLQEVGAPIEKLAMQAKGENEYEWEPHQVGELWTYKPFDPLETYYIGADVALGIKGGDYSVAQVLDSNRRQVATYKKWVDPAFFATVLFNMATYYNNATLIVENNNHGILTCARLGTDFDYPNLYLTTEVDKLTNRESTRVGFSTNVKTKPLIIDQLRACIREGTIEINDGGTLKEMLTYVVSETGALEAEVGCHDDCVMALAMVNHIHEGKFTAIETTDEWYIEQI